MTEEPRVQSGFGMVTSPCLLHPRGHPTSDPFPPPTDGEGHLEAQRRGPRLQSPSASAIAERRGGIPAQKRERVAAAGSPPRPLRSHSGAGAAEPGETGHPPPVPPNLGDDVMVGEGRAGGGDPAPPFFLLLPPSFRSAGAGPSSPDGAARGRVRVWAGVFCGAIPTPGGGSSVCASPCLRVPLCVSPPPILPRVPPAPWGRSRPLPPPSSPPHGTPGGPRGALEGGVPAARCFLGHERGGGTQEAGCAQPAMPINGVSLARGTRNIYIYIYIYIKKEEGKRKKKKNPSVSSPHVRAGRGREAVLPPPPPNGANHSQLFLLARSLFLPLSLPHLRLPPCVQSPPLLGTCWQCLFFSFPPRSPK